MQEYRSLIDRMSAETWEKICGMYRIERPKPLNTFSYQELEESVKRLVVDHVLASDTRGYFSRRKRTESLTEHIWKIDRHAQTDHLGWAPSALDMKILIEENGNIFDSEIMGGEINMFLAPLYFAEMKDASDDVKKSIVLHEQGHNAVYGADPHYNVAHWITMKRPNLSPMSRFFWYIVDESLAWYPVAKVQGNVGILESMNYVNRKLDEDKTQSHQIRMWNRGFNSTPREVARRLAVDEKVSPHKITTPMEIINDKFPYCAEMEARGDTATVKLIEDEIERFKQLYSSLKSNVRINTIV